MKFRTKDNKSYCDHHIKQVKEYQQKINNPSKEELILWEVANDIELSYPEVINSINWSSDHGITVYIKGSIKEVSANK